MDMGGVGQPSRRGSTTNRHPHTCCATYDLPVVEPIAKRTIGAGLSDRVTTEAGDVFADPLPAADSHHHGPDPP
jgi:hypothetical protein